MENVQNGLLVATDVDMNDGANTNIGANANMINEANEEHDVSINAQCTKHRNQS